MSGYLSKEFQSHYKDLYKDLQDLRLGYQSDYKDLQSSVATAAKLMQEWNRKTENLKELNTTSPKKSPSAFSSISMGLTSKAS